MIPPQLLSAMVVHNGGGEEDSLEEENRDGIGEAKRIGQWWIRVFTLGGALLYQ
jgi:hypothetical protein